MSLKHLKLGKTGEDLASGFLRSKGYKIQYDWTQKVSGVWPQKGQSIDEIAENAKASVNELMATTWIWEFTQYDAENAVKPVRGDEYVVMFLENGKFELIAQCGTWKGTYAFSGRSLTIDMKRNWLSAWPSVTTTKV